MSFNNSIYQQGKMYLYPQVGTPTIRRCFHFKCNPILQSAALWENLSFGISHNADYGGNPTISFLYLYILQSVFVTPFTHAI